MKGDIDVFSCLRYFLGHLKVGGTGGGVSARVVVGDDDGSGSVPYGWPEDFPRVDQAASRRSRGYVFRSN